MDSPTDECSVALSVLDRGLVNCLDPGPCHNEKGASVWERARCPTPDPAPALIPPGEKQKRLSSHRGN
jgi:hypothetical protein